MKRIAVAGFTLIELLVVIGILSLLMVVLVPQVLEGRKTADIFADQKNLGWHFESYTTFKMRKHAPPPAPGGHKFVLAPWVMGVVGHTEENRDRYFQPGKQVEDPHWGELKQRPIDEIWKSYAETSSLDTHYAGRSSQHRLTGGGEEALMANDNEFGNAYEDGTINVLMASGSVRTLYKTEQLKEFWPEQDPDFVFPVGPDSPLKMLQKLEK